VLGVHHAAICTADVERSLRFWRDGLGLSELFDHAFSGIGGRSSAPTPISCGRSFWVIRKTRTPGSLNSWFSTEPATRMPQPSVRGTASSCSRCSVTSTRRYPLWPLWVSPTASVASVCPHRPARRCRWRSSGTSRRRGPSTPASPLAETGPRQSPAPPDARADPGAVSKRRQRVQAWQRQRGSARIEVNSFFTELCRE
jgi:hypothetical protein